MDDPIIPEENLFFYSRSTVEPFLKLTFDELLTPVPSDYRITTIFHHQNQVPREKIEIATEFTFRPFTFLLPFQYPEFHRSSHIFNYIINKTKKLFYPILPYDPNYIGIYKNMLEFIKNSISYEHVDPFKEVELDQIINHFIYGPYRTRIIVSQALQTERNNKNNKRIK